MSQSDPPPAPDYTPIANASKEQAELANKLAQEQLAWAKQVYAENKPLSDQIVHSFIDTQNQANENARKDRARYESTYQPLEDQLVADAQSYANPARRDLEMGRASAAVAQQFDAQRQNATRDLEAFGLKPSDVRYAALDIGLRANQAASQAAAANQAGERVDATGRALRDQAINIGKGYPAQVNASYQTGNQGGAGGSNGMNQFTSTTSNSYTQPGTYTGQAGQAIGNWGNIVNQGYDNQLNAWKAGQSASSGIGSALGLVGSAFLSPAKPWIFAADGGAIPSLPEGYSGPVPAEASPSRGKAVDDVPAALNVGEFVIPEDVMRWEGEKSMHKFIEKARTDRAETEGRTGAIPDVHPAQKADAIHAKAMPRRRALKLQ